MTPLTVGGTCPKDNACSTMPVAFIHAGFQQSSEFIICSKFWSLNAHSTPALSILFQRSCSAVLMNSGLESITSGFDSQNGSGSPPRNTRLMLSAVGAQWSAAKAKRSRRVLRSCRTTTIQSPADTATRKPSRNETPSMTTTTGTTIDPL